MRYFEVWRKRAARLKQEVYALYFAYRDPRVPWYAKLFAACVVAYALSPIDLIPDPIPVIGYFDDVVLLPLGIYLALKMIPEDVIQECRQKAETVSIRQGAKKWIAAGVVITIWIALAAFIIAWMI